MFPLFHTVVKFCTTSRLLNSMNYRIVEGIVARSTIAHDFVKINFIAALACRNSSLWSYFE